MQQITTTIDIDAPIDTVWRRLTDLGGHEAWNPFITSAAGTVAEGERIEVTMTPPGRRASTFRPTITVADEPTAFEWLGSVGRRGVFDGRHTFRLEPIDGGTRFTQSEQFTGLLARPLLMTMRSAVTEGFASMNAALKNLCEAETVPGRAD
jgi:hypothetical protein